MNDPGATRKTGSDKERGFVASIYVNTGVGFESNWGGGRLGGGEAGRNLIRLLSHVHDNVHVD